MDAARLPDRSAVRREERTTIASTGVWVGVATISMSFAAYTSAMVVRQGASGDWLHFGLPVILYLNTALILASSVTVELARRNHLAPVSQTGAWLNVTLAMGVLFLLGQLVAWRQLASQGLFLATNPSSAFFYILTALHGLHVGGGLCGLVYARYRLRHGPVLRATSALGAAALYWHFMAALWIYLLLLLVVRL